MEYLRLAGEAVGSLQTLMLFNDEIQIHRRQCSILANIFSRGVKKIATEIQETFNGYELRQKKWKFLEPALKELYTTVKGGELFVRQCVYAGGGNKDWWANLISLCQTTEALDLHLHNFMWCISVVIDCIEIASEETAGDEEEKHKRKLLHCKKYDRDWVDPKLFEWQFGKQYLVSPEIKISCNAVWKEDKKMLLEMINGKMSLGISGLDRREYRIAEFLCRKLGDRNGKLPSCLLLDSKELHVKRRIGSGGYSEVKEIVWMGESFAMRHMFTNVEAFAQETSVMSNLLHPNIMQAVCCLIDKERNECSLLMELMHKDLRSFIKEKSSPRKRTPFSLLVAVDIMLQIARGMEYLHKNGIIHGDLKPSSVLVKLGKMEVGQVHVKISDFGLTQSNVLSSRYSPTQHAGDVACWWRAPEVFSIRLEDELAAGNINCPHAKYTQKADVYGFGMISYEILTGKIPFEDARLKAEIASKVKAGERPLFPSTYPRYIATLVKKCWHADQNQRPSFASISRILRHIKRKLFLIVSADNQVAQDMQVHLPEVSLYDIETSLAKRLPEWGTHEFSEQVANIPFQMFAFKVMEKEKDFSISAAAVRCGGEDQVLNDENSEQGLPDIKLITPTSPGFICSSPLNRSSIFNKKILPTRSPGQSKERTFRYTMSPDRRKA